MQKSLHHWRERESIKQETFCRLFNNLFLSSFSSTFISILSSKLYFVFFFLCLHRQTSNFPLSLTNFESFFSSAIFKRTEAEIVKVKERSDRNVRIYHVPTNSYHFSQIIQCSFVFFALFFFVLSISSARLSVEDFFQL